MVRIAINNHVGRLAAAMPGTRLNTNQDRCVPGLSRLNRGSVLETMPGNDAVVGIGGGYQYRRILVTRLDVVVRRIRIQRFELLKAF